MIVLINGSFGVGKTTVAKRLTALIPNSIIYDPEEIGFMLSNIIPDHVKKPTEKTNNFQDLELWRLFTVEVARSLQGTYQKNLIVPMTICNKSYFQYIRDGFEEFDRDLYHFCLIADENTIYDRLRLRGEVEGNWCFHQVPKCVEALNDELFGVHIQTDTMDPDEIGRHIQEQVRLR